MDTGFRRYDEMIKGSLIVDAVILSIPDCTKNRPDPQVKGSAPAPYHAIVTASVYTPLMILVKMME